MPNCCAILSCRNASNNVGRDNGNISFHCFPSDPNVKEKWIDATGHKDWFPTKHSRICSIHFNEGCFTETNKSRRLFKTAIPTIDVLKMSTDDDNLDPILRTDQPLPCKAMSRKIKLKKDIYQSSENAVLNTPKEKILLHKLNHAQLKIQQQSKEIKRLKEQNRRKGLKILKQVSLITYLKKKYLLSDEQTNLLDTTNVTT